MNPLFNHFKYKPILLLLLCLAVFSTRAGAKAETPKPVLVLPFKVTPSGENAHQWLGRAVSFYIISGLQRNALPVKTDQYTESILEMNHIMFPYNITKASVIRLARENGLDRVIWGEIILDDGETDAADKSLFQLRSFIIDLSDYSQHHLPLIKGSINRLYEIKNELVTAVIRKLCPDKEINDIRFPDFNLNHRGYEVFIKSLLVKEPSKRIKLLEKARKASQVKNSSILDFELAKLHFNSGELDTSKKFLEKISSNKEETNPLLNHEKIFLTGLIAYAGKDITAAVQAFNSLLTANQLGFALHHNLGVIHLQRKDYQTAEKHFRYALEERKHPETWWNLVHVLLTLDNPQSAAQQLYQVLRLYPQEEKLVEMFSYFISQSQNQRLLFPLFQNYIPNLPATEELPVVSLELINPFNFKAPKPYRAEVTDDANEILDYSNGLRDLTAEDIDEGIERLQELLELNPFDPDHYRLISLLYLKKKEFKQAELHALALIFLEKTRENYLHLVKVYKAGGNRKKAKEAKKTLSIDF